MIDYIGTRALVQRMKNRGLVSVTGSPAVLGKIVKEPRRKPQRPICKACKSNRKPNEFGNCANCGQKFVAI